MIKRFVTLALFCCTLCVTGHAQRYALIDMEYILQYIPAYEEANNRLEALLQQWQSEVEAATGEAKALYEDYQKTAKNLSETQKQQREEAIVAKEKTAGELRRNYFGQEGAFYRERENLMAPIQNKIYEAVKSISTQRGYTMVIDRASATSIIFASPSIDISNDVLTKLGYSN